MPGHVWSAPCNGGAMSCCQCKRRTVRSVPVVAFFEVVPGVHLPDAPSPLCPLAPPPWPAVWIGALTGVAISVVIGIVFIILFYVANNKIFSGHAQVRRGGFRWSAGAIVHVTDTSLTGTIQAHCLRNAHLPSAWPSRTQEAGRGGPAYCRTKQAAALLANLCEPLIPAPLVPTMCSPSSRAW